MTFYAIAKWLNKEGYLTVRGKKFRGEHVQSILKKRLAKVGILNREYPPVWSDFSMEVADKTILMSYFDKTLKQIFIFFHQIFVKLTVGKNGVKNAKNYPAFKFLHSVFSNSKRWRFQYRI